MFSIQSPAQRAKPIYIYSPTTFSTKNNEEKQQQKSNQKISCFTHIIKKREEDVELEGVKGDQEKSKPPQSKNQKKLWPN